MRLIALSALAALALGCEKSQRTATPPPPGAPAAAPADTARPASPAAAATSLVLVQMVGNGTSRAAFHPATLTIAAGATVRFVNVSGGPHNVAFWADSIPPGGADALKAGMTNPLTPLTGPFLTQPGQTYDVSFAGAPPGVYLGYCQPHIGLGMRLRITVR